MNDTQMTMSQPYAVSSPADRHETPLRIAAAVVGPLDGEDVLERVSRISKLTPWLPQLRAAFA